MTQPMLPDDRRSLTLRLSVLQYLIAFLFASLAVAFWIFQIANHDRFREMADNNYMQRLPLPAPRGVLYDRNNKVLVNNQSTTNIVLVREQTKNIERTLRIVARAAGVDETQLAEEVRRRRREPSYRPIVLIENASDAQVAAIAARKLELPGILPLEVPSREYMASELAAHLFGYVGEVRETQLQKAEYAGVEAGAIVGQAGVEQAYNKLLMGNEGNRSVIVNVRGQEVQQIGLELPKVGTPLQLTIDADLQKAAEDGFRHYGIEYSGAPYNGAAVVLDPRNGEVLTLASLPAFDPNKFAVGIDTATWRALQTDNAKPMQNRALQATYSPGSTFKLVVATAAMEEGIATPDFRVTCTGGKFFYTRVFACHLKGGHGSVDMRHAIEKSCNVYFYTLGQMLGVNRIQKWAAKLGLGQLNGIDIPNELPGLVPSEEWKQRVMKEKWYPGETISVAIGQGQVNVTPLSLAVMMMTIGNGGTRYAPHVLKAVNKGTGWEAIAPAPPKSVSRMKDSTVKALRDGLWLAVNGAGTAGRARIAGRDVAGKTGTAQTVSLENQRRMGNKREAKDHGWFVFLAPKDNPEIAGVIFAEHAEHGYYGASIAKHIIETYYAKKDGLPLPQLNAPPPPAKTVVATAAAVPAPRAGGGQ
jgi:penicillin-binding protein 2